MTLTPEMVDTYRLQFERVVRAWPNYTERTLARDGRATDYYGNPVVQGAWEGFKAGRAQSQRAVGVEAKLDAPAKVGAVIFREGVSWSSVIACAQRAYAHKDDPDPSAEDVEKLRALIERAGGGV